MRFAFAKASRQDSRPKGKAKSTKSSYQPVSVIVCAKNEAQNLRNNIPKWLDQEHPNFQLVLINDASIDQTKEVMEEFAVKDSRITIVNVENNEAFWANKKYALTLGIKRAEHDILLFTDADCEPASRNWIAAMTAGISREKQLVIGYGGYLKIKGSLLNILIRFETVFTALQYLGHAIWGRSYMGVGRNLAYTSNLYYDQSGFMNHMQIPSGDDDLFVNGASTSKNTTLAFQYDSFTLSEPKRSFKNWITQKRRHVNVAHLYKWRDRFKLGLFYSSQLMFVVLSVVLLCMQFNWELVTLAIGIRYVVSWTVITSVATKLKEKDTALLYPFLEIFLIIFQLSIFISNLIAKPNRWK